MSDQRFEKKVAALTGGADGIGRAVAQRLAREGVSVTLLDRDPPEARSHAGGVCQ